MVSSDTLTRIFKILFTKNKLNIVLRDGRRYIFLKSKRPLVRPRRRWEGNIRIDLKEICFNTRNWVESVQDRDY